MFFKFCAIWPLVAPQLPPHFPLCASIKSSQARLAPTWLDRLRANRAKLLSILHQSYYNNKRSDRFQSIDESLACAQAKEHGKQYSMRCYKGTTGTIAINFHHPSKSSTSMLVSATPRALPTPALRRTKNPPSTS